MKWTIGNLKKFESNLSMEFEKGTINCPLHLSGGNEEQLLHIYTSIKTTDWVFSTHRNHYHALLKGIPPNAVRDEVRGLPTGICGGKARSMNLSSLKHRFITSAIVGGNCALAVGVAMGVKKENSKSQVWCFIGDGAEDSGHFMEALRFTISRNLPLTFIIEDNDFSTDSTKKDRWHNYVRVESTKIIRYEYKRIYPHVGIGKRITF